MMRCSVVLLQWRPRAARSMAILGSERCAVHRWGRGRLGGMALKRRTEGGGVDGKEDKHH